jgi:hypothetical protein
LQETVPPVPDTEESFEGTAAHVVAMAHAMGPEYAAVWAVGHKFESGGRVWTITKDMHEGAQIYAHAIGGYHGHNRLEDTVRVSRIHPEHCYGTPDYWRYFPIGEYTPLPSAPNFDGKTWHVIRVADYKFGHRYVEIFENAQLIPYGFGVLERLNLLDLDVVFEFVIVQPRCFSAEPVRVWRVRASELRAWMNIAFGKVADALGENPKATTGHHCLDCKARHLCGTLRTSNTRIVEYAGAMEPVAMDVTAMGQELRILEDAADQLEARRTGLRAQVEAHIRAGHLVPFWGLKPGRSNRVWGVDEHDKATPAHIADAMALLGVNIRKPDQIMTPKQAIDAGLDEGIVGEYSHRAKPAMHLKPDDSVEIRKIFYKGVAT